MLVFREGFFSGEPFLFSSEFLLGIPLHGSFSRLLAGILKGSWDSVINYTYSYLSRQLIKVLRLEPCLLGPMILQVGFTESGHVRAFEVLRILVPLASGFHPLGGKVSIGHEAFDSYGYSSSQRCL